MHGKMPLGITNNSMSAFICQLSPMPSCQWSVTNASSQGWKPHQRTRLASESNRCS